MPRFVTLVEGRDFVFEVDGEPQHLDFHRTVPVDAADPPAAAEAALALVQHELARRGLAGDGPLPPERLAVEEVRELAPGETAEETDFVWHLAEEDELLWEDG